MKIKNLFYTLLSAVVLLAGATSCNDDSPTTLQLEVKTLYAKAGEDVSIWLRGNGGYELKVSNESVLTATVENNYSYITMHPLTKGTTTLTVTDSDNQTATATIHVKDPYIGIGVVKVAAEIQAGSDAKTAIGKDLEKYILQTEYLYDLAKNESLSFVEYKGLWTSSARTGTYSFSEDAMEITLDISGDEHTFSIENNTYGKMFYDYFVSDKLPGSITDYPLFTLTEDMTAIFKDKYPDGNVTGVKVVTNVQAIMYRAE